MALGVNIVSEFNAKGIDKAIRDFKKLEGAGNKSAYALKTFDKAVFNGVKNVAKAAAGVGAFAGAIGYKLASAAYESQKVMAQTNAILESTGYAAGLTGEQIASLSEKLSMQIGVDDELIQKSANLLLTFKQVQDQAGANNDIFTRAVTLSQDLGNVFGSADAAAMQLGKALSDPEKGITALRRAGINFTDQQKEQIAKMMKANDLLGAQKLILAEVESQVGGTAAASATGFDKMRVAVGNVAEKFGGILIPYIERFATFVIDRVVPYMSRLAEVMGNGGVGAGLKMLSGDLLNAIQNATGFGAKVYYLVAALLTLRLATIAAGVATAVYGTILTIAETGLLGATAAQWALNTAMEANPVGAIVGLVVGLAAAIVFLAIKFKFVRDALLNVFAALSPVGMALKVLSFFHRDAGDAAKYQTGEVNKLRNAYVVLGGSSAVTNEKNYKFFRDSETGASRVRLEVLRAKNGFQDLGGSIGGAADKAAAFKEKVDKVVSALKGLDSEQKSVKDANKAVSDALDAQRLAHDKVTEALAKFTKVSQGYGSASKEAAKQSRAVADAQRELVKANTSVADATTNLARAEEALKKLREKPSALTMDNAEIGLEQAKLDAEKATFDVIDAEKELAALRTSGDATPEEIRKAEISLQEAKWAQRDATLKVAEAEASLKKLREDTPTAEDIAVAERDVADAKLAVEEALIAQQDATQKVNDENLLYSQIVSGAAEDTDIYKEALKELNDAKKDEADANDTVTDSYDRQREAIEKLIEAEQNLAEVKKSSGAKAVAAAKAQIDSVKAGAITRLGPTVSPAILDNAALMDLAMRRFTPFANGGIVKSPTLGLVGEAGPEAVVPLDQLGGMGGNTYITVNAGMGVDGAEVGKQIIDAIKKAERRSGKVFASA